MDPRSIVLAERMFSVTGLFLLAITAVALLRDKGLLKEHYRDYSNFAVLYITLPAFVFIAIIRSQLRIELLNITAAAFLVMFAVLAAVLILISRLRPGRQLYGSFILAATLGNTAYFGYPAVYAVFGEAKLINAIFYDYAVGVFIYTVAIYIAQTFGSGKEVARVSSAILAIVKFPAFLALVPAIALKGTELPILLTDALGYVGMSTVPLVILSIGLSFRFGSIRANKPLVLLVAVAKLLFSPLVAYGIGQLLGLRPDMLSIAVVQAAMPTAMMTVILGAKYGLDVDFLANTVFVTTALSVVTLPLITLALI